MPKSKTVSDYSSRVCVVGAGSSGMEAALYLNGVWGKDPSCKWLKRNKCDPVEDLSGGIRFQKTYRHQLEVEHASYTRQLKRLVRQLKKNTGNDTPS